jgi:ubiquinone/menaquinone biosynthesis C-methylase UbiE
MDYVTEILKKLPARTALDVATGLGYMAKKISDNCPIIDKIYAIDLNNKAIENAVELNEDEKIEFSVMDAEQLRFAGNSLDLVAMQDSLHHFLHPEKCVEEMIRVLKPNAPLLIHEQIDDYETKEQKIALDWHKIGIKIDQRKGLPHYEMFTGDLLKEFFAKFEFMQLAIERESNTTVIKEPTLIDGMISALYKYYEKVKNDPDKLEIYTEIEEIKKDLKQYGFAYPPAMVIFAIK